MRSVPALLAWACLAGCATAGDDLPPGEDDGGRKPDAPPGEIIDAGPADADLPDGPPLPPSAIVDLEPSLLVLARGASGSLTLTLDRPALAGGQFIDLSTDDPGGTSFTIPADITVPEGEISIEIPVTSVAYSTPMDVRARLGSAPLVSSTIHIVPAFVSIAPTEADITIGTTVSFTVTMEAAITQDYTLAISSSDATIAPTLMSTAMVRAGTSSTSFQVTGAKLGTADVSASLGGGEIAAEARVVGLYLSEALFNTSGTDDRREWVELYNATDTPINVAGMTIRAASRVVGGSVPYEMVLSLAGTVPARSCVVVGGPDFGVAAMNSTDGATTNPYFVSGDFSIDLGNASSDIVDAIGLATAGGQLVDTVLYGVTNPDGVVDETGAVGTADVAAPPAAQSIERTAPGRQGPWAIALSPTPGNCAPIVD